MRRTYRDIQADVFSPNALLRLTDRPSLCYEVNIKVREIYIGTYAHVFGVEITRLLGMNRFVGDERLAHVRAMVGRLVAISLLPVHLFSRLDFLPWKNRNSNFWLIRRHICVHFATHLHYKKNCEAAAAALVDYIKSQPGRPAVMFGVICSAYHCVAVRITSYGTEFTVGHTDSLEYLPTFDARSPSTAGITSLVRLGSLNAIDDAQFFAAALNEM
jgi:hypothetical protein